MATSTNQKCVVVGVSGSIAAVKAPELVRLLKEEKFDVRCVLTPSAKEFVSPLALATFSGNSVPTDMFGLDASSMPHLTLAQDADVFVVAPATAALLSRLASGQSDDLVSLTYLTTQAPTVVVPAMHPTMWTHPATQRNIKILKEDGVTFVGPTKGALADETSGEGRMVEPAEIVAAVKALLSKKPHS